VLLQLPFLVQPHKELQDVVFGELCDIEVVLYDERLSTANAHTILNITNTRGEKRKSIIDEMSACLILQSYLDREEKNG
jgi:putative Holliday junction resolvase